MPGKPIPAMHTQHTIVSMKLDETLVSTKTKTILHNIPPSRMENFLIRSGIVMDVFTRVHIMVLDPPLCYRCSANNHHPHPDWENSPPRRAKNFVGLLHGVTLLSFSSKKTFIHRY
jgi:hypothetical protein